MFNIFTVYIHRLSFGCAIMLKAASGIFAHATHGKGALLRGTSLAAYFHEGLTCKSSQEAPSAEQETVNYDVCIVGAGPAGLAAAIRFKQVGPRS